ncbi:hypothetical protein AMECASPLE_003007 [Ameca splendens]|uniref:Uncharacterized protein n=1 Tax=Ameca splendens TaxID=208324 RepID=A0ABV0XYA7_9TELE
MWRYDRRYDKAACGSDSSYIWITSTSWKTLQEIKRGCREQERMVKETRTTADSLCSYFIHHCVYSMSPSVTEAQGFPRFLPSYTHFPSSLVILLEFLQI